MFIPTSPVQHIFSRVQMLGTSSCCCMNMPGPTCRMVPSPSPVRVGHWSKCVNPLVNRGKGIAVSQREREREEEKRREEKRREESVYADVRRIKNPLSIPKWMYNCMTDTRQRRRKKWARLTIHHPAGKEVFHPG